MQVDPTPTVPASEAQPPHAFRAGALQLTAFVLLHAYFPAHPSVPVQALPGVPASAEQPLHALRAGALQATEFVPLHA
jgi:hypothetical protein